MAEFDQPLATPPVDLCLLGGFAVVADGTPIAVATSGQRVLAMLDLYGGGADRSRIAGTLWPDSDEKRAEANLRGAVWRMPDAISDTLVRSASRLAFGPQWSSDTARAAATARALAEGASPDGIDRDLFCRDLLPAWDEVWLDLPRERHRQLRLHALESLAEAQLRADAPLDAVDTAMEAVTAEPLRESAQYLLLRAHLAAGNRQAAARAFARFRDLLRAELGVDPSAAVLATIGSLDPEAVTME